MDYKLKKVSKDEAKFFYSKKELDEKAGCIGHLRMDFGNGTQFYSTWWDRENAVKTPEFKKEFDDVINYFRFKADNHLLSSLDGMKKACVNATLLESLVSDVYGFKVETEQHVYYMRCMPRKGDYNLYCYCYHKSQLYKYQGKELLPEVCFSVNDASGELIIIKRGEIGYWPARENAPSPEENLQIAKEKNEILEVSRKQEAAMKFGSMFGWDCPGADPQSYDEDGLLLKKKI